MKNDLKLPIEAGKTYYTRSGRKVKICTTKGQKPYNIIGIISEGDCGKECWESATWTEDGKFDIEFNTKLLDITYEEWEPQDKEPILCWNEDKPAAAELRFYDAKNECTFYKNGRRDGIKFDYCFPFDGKLPPHMDPEKLED